MDAAFTVELESMEGSTKTGQDQLDDIFDEFEAVKAANGCLMVIQNCSLETSPSYFAAVWGGIMSNSTFGLGCTGIITNGFVRDQYQIESMDNDFNYLVFGRGNCALDARGHLQIRSFLQPIAMPGLDFHNRAENHVRIEPGEPGCFQISLYVSQTSHTIYSNSFSAQEQIGSPKFFDISFHAYHAL